MAINARQDFLNKADFPEAAQWRAIIRQEINQHYAGNFSNFQNDVLSQIEQNQGLQKGSPSHPFQGPGQKSNSSLLKIATSGYIKGSWKSDNKRGRRGRSDCRTNRNEYYRYPNPMTSQKVGKHHRKQQSMQQPLSNTKDRSIQHVSEDDEQLLSTLSFQNNKYDNNERQYALTPEGNLIF